MAAPGQPLREVWTADFYNQLRALLRAVSRASGSGPLQVTGGKGGLQFSLARQRNPLSTLQGEISGGSQGAVTDGTTILDLYAWGGYSIQAAAFILSAGTTNLTVTVNGTPVSWLNNLAITTTMTVINIAVPAPDLTNVISPGDELAIVVSGSSGAAAGLNFSLNCPF